jgi:hypothetical protein
MKTMNRRNRAFHLLVLLPVLILALAAPGRVLVACTGSTTGDCGSCNGETAHGRTCGESAQSTTCRSSCCGAGPIGAGEASGESLGSDLAEDETCGLCGCCEIWVLGGSSQDPAVKAPSVEIPSSPAHGKIHEAAILSDLLLHLNSSLSSLSDRPPPASPRLLHCLWLC